MYLDFGKFVCCVPCCHGAADFYTASLYEVGLDMALDRVWIIEYPENGMSYLGCYLYKTGFCIYHHIYLPVLYLKIQMALCCWSRNSRHQNLQEQDVYWNWKKECGWYLAEVILRNYLFSKNQIIWGKFFPPSYSTGYSWILAHTKCQALLVIVFPHGLWELRACMNVCIHLGSSREHGEQIG